MPTKENSLLALDHNKKIASYEATDIKQLSVFLLQLAKLIGITEPPDNTTIVMLIEFMQEFHSDFSQEEIKKAFGMAMADQLGFEFRHYNRLTPQLISHVLNPYKTMRAKERIKAQDKADLEEQNKSKEQTPEEELQGRILLCTTLYNSFKEEQTKPIKERLPIIDFKSLVWDFLEDTGVVEVSEKKIIEYKKRVKESPVSQHKQALGRIYQQNNIIEQAKQLALHDYFSAIFRNDIDLNDAITSALKRANS